MFAFEVCHIHWSCDLLALAKRRTFHVKEFFTLRFDNDCRIPSAIVVDFQLEWASSNLLTLRYWDMRILYKSHASKANVGVKKFVDHLDALLCYMNLLRSEQSKSSINNVSSVIKNGDLKDILWKDGVPWILNNNK